MHSRCALMRRARAAIELCGHQGLVRRSARVCAGFINKCTRKLRVNYGVNETLDHFSRKERPGPCVNRTLAERRLREI